MIEVSKLLIPLWTANVFVNIFYFFRKKYRLSDYPLDGNKLWFDGRRILGDSKTIFGFPIALLGGIVGGIIVHSNGFLSGLAVYLGAIVSGFIKRRLGLKRGESFWIVDQSDYLFLAYPIFAIFWEKINLRIFFIALIITIPIHFLTNIIAFKLKIRETYQ
ncbi:MAG: CDP-archaeol synthase [Patescibacteria group bacterium]|jgi:CDP-2,3-bis-(O-geranylgeranyl)-sn-glycerol synthase